MISHNSKQHIAVDVVILSLNRPRLTREAVESALRQEGVYVRVIVVDQGSSTDLLLALRDLRSADSRVDLVELGQNLGVPGGRNVGMRRGEAPFIVSIDNDAEFETPHDIRKMVSRFQEDERLGAISFRILNYQTGEDDDTSWVHPATLRRVRDQSFDAANFIGCGHAIRREALEEVGDYDPSLFFMWEEYDLSLRLINGGYRIRYAPEIRILHKVAPEARVRWDGDRFYYLVRNSLYLEYKFRGWSRGVFARMVGYPVKGAVNRALRQAVRGLRDGIVMCREAPEAVRSGEFALSPEAEAYLHAHDRIRRGGLLRRVREQLLATVPGNSRRGQRSPSTRG